MPIFNSWLAPKIANLNCFLADYYTTSSYPVQHVSRQARTPDVILQNPGNQTAKQNIYSLNQRFVTLFGGEV